MKLKNLLIILVTVSICFFTFACFSRNTSYKVKRTSEKLNVTDIDIGLDNNEFIRFSGNISDYNNENVTEYGVAFVFGELEATDEFYAGNVVNNMQVFKATTRNSVNGIFFNIVADNILITDYNTKIYVRAFVIDNNEAVYSDTVFVKGLPEIILNAKSIGIESEFVNNGVNQLENQYKRVVIDNNRNSISFCNSIYTKDLSEVGELFIDDYNNLMNTNILSTTAFAINAVGSNLENYTKEEVEVDNLYVFFNRYEKQMILKWGFILDTLLLIDDTNLNEQIKIVKGESTNYQFWFGGSHLASYLESFLSKLPCVSVGVNNVVDFASIDASSYYDVFNTHVVYLTKEVDRIQIGQTYLLPDETEQKAGYQSMYVDKDTNDQYLANTLFTVKSEDVTLDYVFEPVEYSIQLFDGEEIVTHIYVPESYTIESEPVYLPVILKDNYEFLGWFDNQDFTGEEILEIPSGSVGDKVFYVNYERTTPYEISVNYDLNEGLWTSEALKTFTPLKELNVTLKNAFVSTEFVVIDDKSARYDYWHKLFLKLDTVTNVYSVVAVDPGQAAINTFSPDEFDLVLALFELECLDDVALEFFQDLESKLKMLVVFSDDLNKLNATTTGNVKAMFFEEDTLTKDVEVVLTEKTMLLVPRKVGYSFVGWVSSIDGQLITEYPGYMVDHKTILYTARWEEYWDGLQLISEVSDVVTSNTLDYLPLEYNGVKLMWESSDPNLYTISGEMGYTNKKYQTHKMQTVDITLSAEIDGVIQKETKTITISPVLFEDMTNPKAVYFAIGSAGSYVANSQRYRQEGTMFSEKFRENMDMVYYAFGIPQANGSVSLNTSYLEQLLELKNDGIRVILVIDGANRSPLQAMVRLCNDDETRAIFVNNIMDLVKRYNFDGVDVDWEYPGTSGLSGFTTEIDQINLNKLLRDLRAEMTTYQDPGGSPYILSVAIPASSWGSQRYDYRGNSVLGGIDDYCDYVNMMSYDLNNTAYTTHLASHYSSNASNDFKFGTVYGTNRFTSLGLTKTKIILGTAAYGKAYRISEDTNVNMNATYPALGLSASLTSINGVTGSFNSGTIYYSGIAQLLTNENYKQYVEYNNGNVVGSYLYSELDRIYITYDSALAVAQKCAYAKANGLGIMIWAYGEDATDTIVNTICDNL